MADDYGIPVIIMNGRSNTRIGFAGDQRPKTEFPTVIGSLSCRSSLQNVTETKVYVGNDAVTLKSELSLRRPDLFSRKNDLETFWTYAFCNVLGIETAEHPVLMIERAFECLAARERVTQIMFETFNVPAFFFVNESAMCVYGSGLSSGTVWVCNDEENPVISVYEGHALLSYRPCFCEEISGCALTEYLQKLLSEKGYSLSHDTVRDIKEKLCYVALDFNKEMASDGASVEKPYQLPNGEVITIGKERFRCPEAMFQTDLCESRFDYECRENWAIHKKLYTKRRQLDEELQKEVYSTILLSGGTTLLPGLAERLKKELVDIDESAFSDVNIIVTPKGKQSAWAGGSKLASQTTFPRMYITKEEYNEYGPHIVNRKCF